MISINNDWEFVPQWSDDFLKGNIKGEIVRIPHNVKELSLHYRSPDDYEMICGYRKKIALTENEIGKKIFLQFDGAAHIAKVYVNGNFITEHFSGYTSFRADITEFAVNGENDICVYLDCTENPSIPPFGFVIDYLTYGGIYSEVWLDVRENTYIDDVFVFTPDFNTICVNTSVVGEYDNLTVEITDADGNIVFTKENAELNETIHIENAVLWDIENPYRYNLKVCVTKDGKNDIFSTKFGIRTAQFKKDGFYLNGKKTFLRGLNRHQSYPYIGYAATESLQREDARILKEELCCTAVRTSHYPQSHHFIDECDRIGLLVFTEIPGWQHIGDGKWKEQACVNCTEMVMQYRNHPSIVLWGVRINESVDDDAFYTKTNEIAHRLDPSRQTSGVRYIEKSHLLEDVYAFNDFSYNGKTDGARPKNKVTTDTEKAFLISECNGHMFPTKSYDTWGKRTEHALRHATVQNSAMQSGEHAGCFGWCMFDYATHKDFGSGDRICYHGVMDSFRNPKLARAVYSSQGEKTPVLEIGSSFDIGDYPRGMIGSVFAFTNADEIRLYKNDNYVTTFKSKNYNGLSHGPVEIDDTIGVLLESIEGFEKDKADLFRHCLLSARKNGLAGMPIGDKLKMAYGMKKYGVSYDDGVVLYGKYVGNWGGEATVWRFDAVKDGEVVKSRICCPDSHLHIECDVSATELCEGDTYDMSAVRVRILDGYGNIASYAQIPVCFETSGDIELCGPAVTTAEGGMCGTYIKTTGKKGTGNLTVKTNQTYSVTITFTVK